MRNALSPIMKKGVEHLRRNRFSFALFKWVGFFTIRFIFPLQYFILVILIDCDSILDLGCGPHSMIPILPRSIHTTGVEFFDPYYQEAVAKGRHHQYIHENILKVDFPEKNFDAVVLLDVLEHLSFEEGKSLIQKMNSWSRKKLVIFTPNGFLPQDSYDDNPLMEHKSGWTAKAMKDLGFKVYGIRGFKALMPKEGFDHDKKEGFFDFLINLTQIFSFHIPSTAFQLFCVKEPGPS